MPGEIHTTTANGHHDPPASKSLPPQTGTTAQAAAATRPPTTNGSTPTTSVLHANLNSPPPKIVSASGNYLTTSTGTQIFDATGGAAVSCLGHAHPRVKQAIVDQLDTVEYTYSPFFTTDASERLAERLTKSTNGEMSKVFIVSSGTEAIEAALKLARQYFVEKGEPERTRFIAREQSYHGNTLGSLSVGGHKARRKVYEPLLSENVSFVSPPYPYRGMKEGESEEEYVQRLGQELEGEFQRVGPRNVCAFVAETMSGLTLGAVPPPKNYLQTIKHICDKHGALLILDEVMSGMGRTGTLHAWSQDSVTPHLQTVAKGLGAGYQPIGALLVHRHVVDVLSHGTGSFVHSQTYQGHPVACAAACAVQKVVEEEGLMQNVRELGPVLGKALQKRLGGHANVGEVRGRGFMWGIELVQDKPSKTPFPASKKLAATIHATGLREEFGISLLPGGGVADGTNGDVVMLAPAYNITREDVELIVERTAKVVERALGA
ncbi:hypothetical protein M409DRAFT_68695 [Zasmidium cellare ATCC 36951]|uniref:Aminotransferase class III n=1 Tax=Zasmidium cellare ATCC 36951 TaxID=1080233 RepID=A0A6A6C796_ZASCE|nr:uncharacterized protein M409DRAFT_68695 [Zasmidium cellare ATCC 36951]KAF2163057.1 hypothetical protein M409DRAFT_68695 [Zasmidium cellare ATCC 36951]